MDFDQLRGDLYELIPENFERTQDILRYITEVEHNTKHIAKEIYDPKREIHDFLITIADRNSAWVQRALQLLK